MKKKNIFFGIFFFFYVCSEALLDQDVCEKMGVISYFYRIETLCKELKKDLIEFQENDYLKENIHDCYQYCLTYIHRLRRFVTLFIKHEEIHLYLKDDIDYLMQLVLDIAETMHPLESYFSRKDSSCARDLAECVIMLTNFEPRVLEVSEAPSNINA